MRVGLREGGKKKSSVFQLKISVTSFLLHHILNSTCVQGVVCLSALGKKHNPCPRNICQRPTAGQRDAATRPFSEEFAPRASFMKPRFIPTIELFSFFLLQKKKKKLLRMISFCRLDCLFFFFFFCVPRIVVLECPDSVSTILFHAMMNERKILTLMQFYGRGAGV